MLQQMTMEKCRPLKGVGLIGIFLTCRESWSPMHGFFVGGCLHIGKHVIMVCIVHVLGQGTSFLENGDKNV